MGEYSSNLQTRFRLEEAKFFFQQMELNFQDSTKLLYFLDAFLASARSVTLVFQKEFHNDKSLMKWYKTKVEEWKNNNIMKFFIEMRNISQKEHTPKMEPTLPALFTDEGFSFVRVSIRKVFPDGTIEQVEFPPREPAKPRKEKKKIAPATPKIVSYSFVHNLKWFDEDPDVKKLCQAYLDELERFVTEAENMIKKGVKP